VSITIASATGATAWGKAVAGAVAVLAIGMGAAVGSFLVAGRGDAVGVGASYVPASAPFYVELRLDASAEQDAALRAALGHFPAIDGIDLDMPLYGQLGDRIDEMLAQEDTDVSWAVDVAPWFDGRIAFAVLDIPVEAMSGELPADADDAPPMVALLGVTDRAAAEASIQRLLAESDDPLTFTDQDHAGVTIHASGDEGAYALSDDQLLLAPRADDIVTALDAHADAATTVAELDDITALTDALPDDWLAFALYDLRDLMAAALETAAAEDADMASAFGALLENQPLRGAFAFTAAGDRLAVDVATDAPTGELAVENRDRGLADEVPSDVIYYSEAGHLGASFTAFIGPMKDAMAATPEGEEQIATMEAALGADLEDLVSWIDDGAVAIGVEDGHPYGGLLLVPNDVDAAGRRLSQLSSFATLAGLDPQSGVTVDESEIGSQTVTTIRWQDSSAMPDPMMPVPAGVTVQYTVTDDRAIIGFGESFVGRVLGMDAGESLGAESRFNEAIDALGGPGSTALTWVDVAAARDAIHSAMAPLIAGFDPTGEYEAEVLPWLEPLDRLVSVTRLDGDLLLQRGALLLD
jgi:hypothetical protein